MGAGPGCSRATAPRVVGYQTSQAVIGYHTDKAGIGYQTNQAGIAYQTSQAGIGYQMNQAGIGYQTNQAGIGYPTNQAGIGYQTNQAGIGYPTNQAGVGYQTNTAGSEFARDPRVEGSDIHGLDEDDLEDSHLLRDGYMSTIAASCARDVPADYDYDSDYVTISNASSSNASSSNASSSNASSSNASSCSDNPDFRDELGKPCDVWLGYDCSLATTWGTTVEWQTALLGNCTLSCGLCGQDYVGRVGMCGCRAETGFVDLMHQVANSTELWLMVEPPREYCIGCNQQHCERMCELDQRCSGFNFIVDLDGIELCYFLQAGALHLDNLSGGTHRFNASWSLV
eukprot:gene32095-40579_t